MNKYLTRFRTLLGERHVRFIAFLLLLATRFAVRCDADEFQADVIVYGSTPGGFCAAVAAAREGASVILLEPTGHVGGVNTGGLSFSDSNQTVRSTMMGLFDEWHSRIEKDYQRRGVELPYKVSEKDNRPWTYEPSVAMRITRDMLREAKVQVLTNRVLKSVAKERNRIQSIVTNLDEFTAKVYVDATYEGDLMAAAGVRWTIGREGRKEFDESLAAKQYPKPKMMISGRDSSGQLLPLITTGDAGPVEEGDRNVMVYSFRLCLTKNPANRVPFPAPTRYDPKRFEVVRRYFAKSKPLPLWDLYPLPNEKIDANNGIHKQFSMGLVGAGNGWCEADAEGRARIWEEHKQYTLELYHFLANDPDVPQSIRQEYAKLGLCRDEFPDDGHWSPQLYVREGRRMIGIYVVNQNDILKESQKDDPIVVSSFPIDSHDCQRVATEDGVINEGTIFPVHEKGRKHGPAYHIPYRSILPKEDECENLLVPVALSCTHVAFSSIRVEPTWMILGQSAGVAAAIAAQQNLAVQQLPYPTLRERLLMQKQVLDLPDLPLVSPERRRNMSIDPAKIPGIVLDSSRAERVGTWTSSSLFQPYVGDGYLHDEKRGDGNSIATFRFRASKAGRYDLRIAYSPHPTRATNVPITVQCGNEKFSISMDQTQPLLDGEAFRSVGTVVLNAAQDTFITITNTGTDGFVILDALQLLEITE